MALIYAERVKEAASNQPATSGTAFNMSGTAKTGHQKAIDGIATTNRSVFVAFKPDGNDNPAGAWEEFVGTVTTGSPVTLSRDHLIKSSTGSFIDWSAEGTNPIIMCVMPASQIVTHPQMEGRWLTPLWQYEVSGAFWQLNELLAMPVTIPEPCLCTGLRFSTSGGSGSRLAVMGIYDDKGGYPGSLMCQSAEQDCSVTGIKSDNPNAFVRPGRAWLAWHGNNNGAQYTGQAAGSPNFGITSSVMGALSGTFNINDGVINKAQTYNATMPSTFPSGGGTRTSHYPLLQFKLDYF